ncbi:MAG TPA: hypothetical protein VH062_08070 [Polyangiaceae bacterium]|jgi:hypothetical protein|nr:hypothetical protein [Polyangiaceae bacterium]
MPRPIPGLRSSRIALIFGTITLLTGCGHPIERALAGRWFGESVESFDAPDVASATGWARGASMEFSDEAITVAIPAEDPRKGHYEVSSAHEGDIVLAIRDDKGNSEKARFTLDGDHYLKWHLDERRSVILRREQ